MLDKISRFLLDQYRRVFRTQSNIYGYDQPFLRKAVNYACKKPSIVNVRLASKYASVLHEKYSKLISITCKQYK